MADKRVRKTKDELEKDIYTAALQLLEQGYEKVTFANVAKLAGTNRPVLYRRWESPMALLTAAEHYFSDDVDSFDQIDFSGSSLRDNLISILDHFDNSPQYMRALLIEMGKGTDYEHKLFADLRAQELFIMERLLSQAQLDGEIKHTVTDFVKMLPFRLLLNQAMIEQREITHEDVLQMVDEVILPAIMAQQ